MKCIKVICVLILLFALNGCANPSIVQISDNLYMLSKEDHAGIFGSMSKLKADVINEVNVFAKSKNKVAVPISVREKPVGNSPADWASFEYQFKLVEKNSPELKASSFNENRTTLPVRANRSVQSSEKISADIKVNKTQNKKTDIYSELKKLDGLRKQGIITDQEFQEIKTKLISEM